MSRRIRSGNGSVFSYQTITRMVDLQMNSNLDLYTVPSAPLAFLANIPIWISDGFAAGKRRLVRFNKSECESV
jgi:hypothetical protein